MLADFGATARLEHARYSLPSVQCSDSSNSLSAASDSDSAVQSSGPSSDIRIEVGIDRPAWAASRVCLLHICSVPYVTPCTDALHVTSIA